LTVCWKIVADLLELGDNVHLQPLTEYYVSWHNVHIGW